MKPRRTGRPATAVLLAAVTLLAAALTWAAGRRGLFPLDQSILFDGGYRVLDGQVPFGDFVMPVGPVAVWVQGALFALFGVGWGGYVASAALLTAAAVAVAFLVGRRLTGGRWAPLLAAAGTGVWFLAPSGTPWMDPLAFLLALFALLALLGRRDAPAGALVVAAFLCKQNAAAAALPLLAAPLAAGWIGGGRPPWRRLGAVLAGAAGAAGLFVAWLALAAEPALFVEHVLRVPAAVGWERLAARPGRHLVTLFTGAGPRGPRGVLLLAVLPALAVLRRPAARPRHTRVAAVAAGLFLAHNLFLVSANNQPEISLPYAGLLLALGGWLAWERAGTWAGQGGGRWAKAGAAILVAVAAAVLLSAGVDTALSRRVHESIPPGATFPRPLEVPGLEALLWAEPTVLWEGWPGHPPGEAVEVRAAHVEALVAHLRATGEPFFVFPDWTLLYAVVGVPSPQPLLWFHPGLTYPEGGDPALDRRIVAALQRHGVETVVLEEVSWLGTGRRLEDFPALAAWIERHFTTERRIGPFRVLARRDGG